MTSVSISVSGVFHAPHLAREVSRRGHLRQLIVGHPKWLGSRPGYPVRALRPAIRPLIFSNRLPSAISLNIQRMSRMHALDRFDQSASRMLSSRSDVVTAWSGSAARTLSKAKRNGQVAALERGSTHIVTQKDILLREHDLFGFRTANVPDDRTIEAELAEYEIADRIFVPSQFAYRSFIAHGITADKLALCPYGVDSNLFRPLRPPPRKFVITHVGAISAQKGVHHLLQAVEELDLPGTEVRLYGVVAPEMLPILERHRERLAHVGRVTKDVLVQALNDSSVMVLASVQEGLAMVLGEAMACGRPVICSDSTGGEDLVDHGRTGFVFPSGSVGDLKESLVQLHGNRDLQLEMGEAARSSAEGVTWERYGETVWSHYQQMLAQC